MPEMSAEEQPVEDLQIPQCTSGPDMRTLLRTIRQQRGDSPGSTPNLAEIPAELMERLVAARSQLTRQGVIQRRKSGWRLRFRGEGIDGTLQHKSIDLKNEYLADAVWKLICQWRNELAEEKAEKRRQDELKRAEKRELNELKAIAAAASGGGQRRQKQVRDWVEEVLANPMKNLYSALTGTLPPPRPRGRPIKTTTRVL